MTHLEHTAVFVGGEDGYSAFRIPVIETAADGTILAFAEGRKRNCGDPGTEENEVHLVLKRSADGGRKWSPMTVIEAPGESWSAANPATVRDRSNGRIWVHYIRCKPGRGSVNARPGTDDIQNMVRYSDDHGLTWQRGAMVPGEHGGNEDQLVELADGCILLDFRQETGPHRWIAISQDGGRTWSDPRPGETVTPVCCAIERYTLKTAGDDRDRIVWTGPKGTERRTNLVVRISEDEAGSFPRERLIAEGSAAYSDMALLQDKSVGVLWEQGPYARILFTRLDKEFLSDAPVSQV
jgi:sialidase-1